MSDLQRHVSDTIRRLRQNFKCKCGNVECHARGLAQSELAGAIGVSTNTISRWETGVYWPAVYDIANMATYYDVPVQMFFPQQGSARPRGGAS